MKRHLLHPGTVLGIVALIVALSGSVYAATSLPTSSVTSVQIKNGSIQLKDLSPAARRALRGAVGATGARGAAGAAGAAGATGAAGSARAFGFVSSTGVVNASRSKNITVTKLVAEGPGVYCVKPAAGSNIDPTTAFPVVSADFTDGSGTIHLAQIVTSAAVPGCALGTGWTVVTDNFVTPNFARADIAFSIVVP